MVTYRKMLDIFYERIGVLEELLSSTHNILLPKALTESAMEKLRERYNKVINSLEDYKEAVRAVDEEHDIAESLQRED